MPEEEREKGSLLFASLIDGKVYDHPLTYFNLQTLAHIFTKKLNNSKKYQILINCHYFIKRQTNYMNDVRNYASGD